MGRRRIALVTGASRGIGGAIAVGLSEDGYDIWLNYRSNHEAAHQVREGIEQAGSQCRMLAFDVADPAAVERKLYPLLEKETPYILVNNAGFTRDMLLIWMGPQDWKDVLSVTLDGFYQVTKGVIKGMLRKRGGRIINIVSTSGQTGMPGQVNYASAKAGLIGATKSLAAEVAKRNVLVNAVSPGFIDTEMTTDIPRDKVLPMIPLQRFGTAQEVAAVVRFLCSEQSSYITGQVIAVNGGIYM